MPVNITSPSRPLRNPPAGTGQPLFNLLTAHCHCHCLPLSHNDPLEARLGAALTISLLSFYLLSSLVIILVPAVRSISKPKPKSRMSLPSELKYIQYAHRLEAQYLPSIRALISKDLSEPYSIYVYRYFLYQWGHLCFMVRHARLPRSLLALLARRGHSSADPLTRRSTPRTRPS